MFAIDVRSNSYAPFFFKEELFIFIIEFIKKTNLGLLILKEKKLKIN